MTSVKMKQSKVDRSSVFLRSVLILAGLPPGKRWMGIEPLSGEALKRRLAAAPNPQGQLVMLRATGGNVESIGHQYVRGVPTTQYRGSFDLQDVRRIPQSRGEESGGSGVRTASALGSIRDRSGSLGRRERAGPAVENGDDATDQSWPASDIHGHAGQITSTLALHLLFGSPSRAMYLMQRRLPAPSFTC